MGLDQVGQVQTNLDKIRPIWTSLDMSSLKRMKQVLHHQPRRHQARGFEPKNNFE